MDEILGASERKNRSYLRARERYFKAWSRKKTLFNLGYDSNVCAKFYTDQTIGLNGSQTRSQTDSSIGY